VEVFLARKGAMRTWKAGVTDVRDLGADQLLDHCDARLINHGEMIGPPRFVCGYGLYIKKYAVHAGENLPAGRLSPTRAGSSESGAAKVARRRE